jgi:hypothetical protein
VIESLEAQIERLAAQLAEDDLRELGAIFQRAQWAPPQLLWNPLTSQVPSPSMTTLLSNWELRGGRRRAAAAQGCLDGESSTLRDWAIRLDISDTGGIVYAQAGRMIIDTLGHDPQGMSLSEMVVRLSAPDMLFYAAGYEACRKRQQPFLTFNESPRLKVRAVSRLVVPYWDQAGMLRSFVTLLATVDRSGTLSQD